MYAFNEDETRVCTRTFLIYFVLTVKVMKKCKIAFQTAALRILMYDILIRVCGTHTRFICNRYFRCNYYYLHERDTRKKNNKNYITCRQK